MNEPGVSIGKKERKKRSEESGLNKIKLGRSRLFNFVQDSYLERTSRPIYAILFLLPFIVFYEIGTFRINTNILNQSQTRVVAFVWLQNFLESVGFNGKFAWASPPLAVIVILLSLQITSRKQWTFWVYDYFLMIIECIFLAIPLIVLTLLLSSFGSRYLHGKTNGSIESQAISAVVCSSINNQSTNNRDANSSNGNHSKTRYSSIEKQPLMASIVTGIGAGIYEELIFRLILICVLMVIFQDIIRMGHTNAIVLSVMISAALFSAHHHIDFLTGRPNVTDPFDITEFAFRTIAGIYFAILYAIRGFGITVGTHAFYNIIAVIITAGFFHS